MRLELLSLLRQVTRTSFATAAIGLFLVALTTTVNAESPKPAFDFEGLLLQKFHDKNGMLNVNDFLVGFAPATFKTELLIFNDQKEVVSRNAFYDDHATNNRDGIWAYTRPQSPHQIRFDKPGIYQMVFMVDDQPVTRFPFRLIETSTGDDPFNPQKTFAFDGLWKRYANIRPREYDFKRTGTALEYTLWTGQLDLAPGAKKDMFLAELVLNGKVVAHSKLHQGFIPNTHYRVHTVKLHQPHEKAKATDAPPYLLEDYADGDYTLRLSRQSDQHVLREYGFNMTGGKIAQLPQTQLNHEPHVDYMLPRSRNRSQRNRLEIDEVHWIYAAP